MKFDASIDVTDAQMRRWTGTPAAAVEAVDAAVRALPGAGWIDVEYCGDAPGHDALRLYPPGRSSPTAGPAWADLAGRIAQVVRRALRSAD